MENERNLKMLLLHSYLISRCNENIEFTEEEKIKLKAFQFLTLKPIIYVANIKEDELSKDDNAYVKVLFIPTLITFTYLLSLFLYCFVFK